MKKTIKGAWIGTLYANPFSQTIKDDRLTLITALAIRRICALKYLDSQKETITAQDYQEIRAAARRRQGTYICRN